VALAGDVAQAEAQDLDAEHRRDCRPDRLQSAEAKILELFTRGKVSEGSLETELARIGRKRTALHQQLEACGRAQVAAADTADRLSPT
jgi:hypothetical protein